ncbi:MAG: SDR family oxidoreductase [Rehaibacterium terrae]|uniref:SDR family oxidoreductase n=2 Tax=Rehaibacterium terrae TaxID=1341696 RepID=UPI00391A8395
MKRVLVTGANRGLGLAFVRRLLARGDRVAAACRHPGRANALTQLAAAHPGHLHVLQADLAKPASIAELAREAALVFDGLELLINNAGVLPAGERFGAVEADTLDHSFRVNAMAPFLLTQALAPLLAKGDRATVLNLGSAMASLSGVREFRSPSYAISKAALNMATRELAQALAPQGIIVLAVSPGWIRTDMGGENAPTSPEDAAAALLTLLDRAGPADSGRFVDRDGEDIPW